MLDKKTFSFKRGYRKLTLDQTLIFRKDLKNALGCTNNTFYRRLRGEVEPKVSEKDLIESLFAKHKVTDIWGE